MGNEILPVGCPGRIIEQTETFFRDLAGTAAITVHYPDVVAAHSNTMHQIVKALGGPEWPEVSEADYENIFVVTASGPGKVVAINYVFEL